MTEEKPKEEPKEKSIEEAVDNSMIAIKKHVLLAYIAAATVGIFTLSYMLASYSISIKVQKRVADQQQVQEDPENYYNTVVPQAGAVFPVDFRNIGKQMISAGVIDVDAFEELYQKRGGLDAKMQELMYGENNSRVAINRDNANVILNYLWAFGLANSNVILDNGPMKDERYGGDAGKFASTGGWTLARGDTMNHYSMHEFVTLTDKQQDKVERVSKNIYRPCCGNSTHFPDCNHGMAMLGLLQIMASQGVSEADMYDTALKVNSYWFPDTYMTLAKYFAKRDVEWKDVDAKEVLGAPYSSGAGFQQILQEVEPVQASGVGGCGV